MVFSVGHAGAGPRAHGRDFLPSRLAEIARAAGEMDQDENMGTQFMIEILDAVGALSGWFWELPRWGLLSLYGVALTYTIAAGGFVLARAGLKPLWILLLLIPTVNVAALWVWAYRSWPREIPPDNAFKP